VFCLATDRTIYVYRCDSSFTQQYSRCANNERNSFYIISIIRIIALKLSHLQHLRLVPSPSGLLTVVVGNI
jgi:hypothetical protein